MGLITVKSFGAVGDGVTDDSSAIQAAINAAGQRGSVYFPAGTYKFSGISITSQISIMGAGYQDGATKFVNPTVSIPFFTVTNSQGVLFSNFNATSSVTRIGGSYFAVTGSSRIKFSDFFMSNHYIGITVNSSDNIIIDSFSIFNGVYGAIQIGNTGRVENTSINNGYIKNETTAANFGIFAGYVDVMGLGDGLVIINQGSCFKISPTSGQTASLINASGTIFDTATDGVQIIPLGGSVIRCNFAGGWYGEHSSSGFEIDGTNGTVSGIKIVGGDFIHNTNNGINITGVNANQITITSANLAANGIGVRLDGSIVDISIENCLFGAYGNASVNTVGLTTTSTPSGTITNCIFNSNTTNQTGLANAPNLFTAGNIGIDNWKTYTPTLSAFSGNFTSATVSGLYQISGNTVILDLQVVITTNGTAAGAVFVSLPRTSKSFLVGTGRANNVSGKMLQAVTGTGGSTVAIYNYDGSYPGQDGEVLLVSGTYEF
jgi:hypothetical protein